jgi:hypothetical protein
MVLSGKNVQGETIAIIASRDTKVATAALYASCGRHPLAWATRFLAGP